MGHQHSNGNKKSLSAYSKTLYETETELQGAADIQPNSCFQPFYDLFIDFIDKSVKLKHNLQKT